MPSCLPLPAPGHPPLRRNESGFRPPFGPVLSALVGAFWGLLLVTQSGCSIRTYALRGAADALSGTGGGLGTDDDPQLVRDAVPFGLKTMESLAESLPDHRPIR